MTSKGLDIRNSVRYDRLTFGNLDGEKSNYIVPSDFEAWGLQDLLGDTVDTMNDQMNLDFNFGRFVDFFEISDINHNATISAGEALYGISRLETDTDYESTRHADGFANEPIDSIGKYALIDYLNSAGRSYGNSEYEKPLIYLFSGLLRDDTDADEASTDAKLTLGEKAKKMADYCKDMKPEAIVDFLSQNKQKSVITSQEVNEIYDNHVRNSQPRSTFRPLKNILLKNIG